MNNVGTKEYLRRHEKKFGQVFENTRNWTREKACLLFGNEAEIPPAVFTARKKTKWTQRGSQLHAR